MKPFNPEVQPAVLKENIHVRGGDIYLISHRPGRDGKLVHVQVKIDAAALVRWSGKAAKNRTGRAVCLGGDIIAKVVA